MAKAENKDPFEGLLKYQKGLSPAQLLMSGRARTMIIILTHRPFLLPQPIDHDRVLKKLHQ